MKFYNEDDMTEENFEKFCQEIDEISRRADEKAKLRANMPTPKFNTIEEALDYYHKQGGLTLEEWEQKVKERLGLEELPYERFDKEDDAEGQKMKESYDSMFMEQYAKDQEIAIITDKKPSNKKTAGSPVKTWIWH